MKNVVLFFSVIILFISVTTFAQIRTGPEERAKALREQLNLTDEQTEQVKQIYVNADDEIKSNVQGSGKREQMRSVMQTVMDNVDNEILKILDEVQQDKYNQIIEERRKEMKDMQRGFN